MANHIWFFVILETPERKPLFTDRALRLRVEQQWGRFMQGPVPLMSVEFAVSKFALYALVRVEPPEQAHARLAEALEAYMAREGAGVWQSPPQIREMRDRKELRVFQDYIVQQMLGSTNQPPPH